MQDILDTVQTDWDYLVRFLPKGWEKQMKNLEMLKFGRVFGGSDGPARLLRVLLIHIAGNASLRTASAIASKGGIVNVSDVSILKRLKKSSKWFTWATNALLESGFHSPYSFDEQEDYNFRFIDASLIEEPGATGSTWRLHYSLNAKNLSPDEVVVGSYRRGETLKNFNVSTGDVFVADRAYGTRASIQHAHLGGGFVVVRASPNQLPMHTSTGQPFQLRRKIRKLKVGEIGTYPVVIRCDGANISGRLCVLRKTKEQAELAQKKIRQRASRNGSQLKKDTLEHANYVMVFTTLPDSIPAKDVMEIYRHRWQIELVFKRMKSILKLAPLYKRSKEGMLGWISGKLFVAVLIDSMIKHAESFSPWGYPI